MALTYNFAGIIAGLRGTITSSGGTPRLQYENNFKGVIQALEDLQTSIEFLASGIDGQSAKYTEASYNAEGNVTRISHYTNSSKTTELVRKTFTYSSGDLEAVAVTDYTRTPNTTYTTTYNRDGNGNLSNWETA
jgi:hypothetical protein